VIRSELPGSVLRGVTQTIRKIGLTSIRPEKERTPDFLVGMNTPALTGIRDAACLRALELFSQPVFSLPEPERIRLYEEMVACLEEAVAAGERLVPGGVPDPAPMMDYLRHLSGMLQAILLLLHREQSLFAREKALAQWLGADFGTALRNTEEVVNGAEVSLYHALQRMIELADTPLARFREAVRGGFSKAEAERHDKAFAEFRGRYRARFRIKAGNGAG
jgi:hypothetical protein